MTVLETPTWIRIDAPGAETAFALERRLAHLHPSVVGRRGAWCVELEDFDDRIGEVEAAVRHWLRATGIRSAAVHVGEASKIVTAEPLEETQLGAGYDAAGALDHEP